MSSTYIDYMKDVIIKTAKAKDSAILAQLNEFISRGLIIVEEGETMLSRQQGSDEIYATQSIVLKLKDQEYIERLENENKLLRVTLDSVSDLLKTKG